MIVITKKQWLVKYANRSRILNKRLCKRVFGKYPKIVKTKPINMDGLRMPSFYATLIKKYEEISRDPEVQRQILEGLAIHNRHNK